TSMHMPADRELGFAFHDYGLCSATADRGLPVVAGNLCAEEDALVIKNALAHVRATGHALLETEFGALNELPVVARQLAQYDAAMIPWMWWSYTGYVVPTDGNGVLGPASAPNIPMLATLARPYPQLIAGTPRAWSYAPAAHVLSLTYAVARAG